MQGVGNNALLYSDKLGVANFNTQVTSRYHHCIRNADNRIQYVITGDYLGSFNLGHNAGITARFYQ